MKVLVDTSIWSLALRRKAHDLNGRERLLVTELSELIRDGRTAIIGLIRQELLSGVKTAAQFEQLRTRLRTFRDEPLNTDDYEACGEGWQRLPHQRHRRFRRGYVDLRSSDPPEYGSLYQ